MSEERKRFEKALEADPCDMATRSVFADWLEERGLDDEAREERRKATAEWVSAWRELEAIALEYGHGDDCWDGKLDVARLLEIGRHSHAGAYESLGSDINHGGYMRERFWNAWATVEGKPPPFGTEDEPEDPPYVSCAC